MKNKQTKNAYNVVTRYDHDPVRNLIKVSTFERNGLIVTTCLDYNTGFARPIKGGAPFRFKKVKDFIKGNNCLTVHYYKNGEYRYTCRTWSAAIHYDNIIKKEL